MERLKIGIIGAGPAGLTLALALAKRNNVEFIVLEKSDDHLLAQTYDPSRSYTIDITGHGANAIQYINAKSRFDRDLIKFKGIKITFVNIVDKYDGDGWTGSRGDICRALQLELQERTGKSLISFNTEATVIDINQGIIQTKDINGIIQQNKFDLIVGADGAGSSSRNQIEIQNPQFKVISYNNENYSIMLEFDQNTDELDPSYLYVFSPPPFLSVAGAVNGIDGKLHPKWFCQIGFSGHRTFKNKTDAKNFITSSITKATNSVLRYASERAIEEFANQTPQPTGRAKECSSFHSGRLILIGDAGAPFPPIGQGVNAAMEMAVKLDKLIGQHLQKGQNQQSYDVFTVIEAFSKEWKPQADAIRHISYHGLDLKQFTPRFYGYAKMGIIIFLHKLFGRDAIQNSKKNNLSYLQALQKQQRIDKFIVVLFQTLVVTIMLFYLTNALF